MREVATTLPQVYVKYNRGLYALKRELQPAENKERRVALLVGATETGKTRMAHDIFGADLYTVFCTKTPWFDGYDNHRYVLIDECGPGMMHWNILKRVLDRYGMFVPIKGGAQPWNPDVIIMTSNVDLSHWYVGERLINHSDYLALQRRIRVFRFPEQREEAQTYLTGRAEFQHIPSTQEELLRMY